MRVNKQQTSSKPKRRPFHEEFAEKIIEHLKAGTAPWQRPWHPGKAIMAPHNPASGTVYRGMNRVHLALSGYDDPRWMTLKQANENDLRILAGSKATPVVYYQFSEERDRIGEDGKPVLGEDGKPQKQTVELDKPLIRFAYVFNAQQIEGMPPLELTDKAYAWEPVEKAEKILSASGANINHDQSNQAFYRYSTDSIHLPPRENFENPGLYYGTSLHELGHWTRHSTRLDRENGPFGSEPYAREELRAEIASWMLGQDIGIPHNPEQHAAYVGSWIKPLEDDPYEIVRACRDAEQIKEYILGLEMKKELVQKPVALHNLHKEMLDLMKDSLPQISGASAENKLKQLVESKHPSPAVVENCFTALAQDILSTHSPSDLSIRTQAILERLNTISAESDLRFNAPIVAKEKTFLMVPFKEKNEAKQFGAKWDAKEKSWFAPEGSDLEKFSRWIPEKNKMQPIYPAIAPEAEFAERLRDAGLDLRGELPIMDGQLHRVPLIDRPHARDGAYRGNLDGRPAGWFQNHVTGETANWKYSGHKLDQKDIAKLREEALVKREVEQQKRQEEYDRAAKRCYAIWKNTPAWATGNETYLQAKGVPAFGIKVDDKDNLLIPGRDANGIIHTLQTITADAKLFERRSQKTGSFHVIDPEKQFGKGPILIAEGYATAASIYMATGQPVVCAFDSGNLLHVAKVLHEKFPEQAIAIMADNDATNQYNPGINKAKLAAEAVGGSVYAPQFSKEETASKMKDWNDLHVLHGLNALRQQIDFSRPLYQANPLAPTGLEAHQDLDILQKSRSKTKKVQKIQDEGLEI